MTRPCLMLLLGLLCLWAPAAAAARGEDPNLDQRIGSAQPIAEDRAVLADGHVDVGPLYVDGDWTLMIHDDRAKAGTGRSVWRHPERTVLRVTDDALLTVPDDPAYGFLPSKPGAKVHVVPQTQDLDVVWVGWNTQDPEVMETIDRGVRMELEGVQGPGELVVFLQSGDFAKPEVLWDSRAESEPVWVDVNTHTHANWVFSKPGVHLARVRISADLIDGTTVTDTQDLRFAVGSAVAPGDALAAAWTGPAADDAEPAATPAVAVADDDGGRSAALAVLLIAAVALAVATALVLLRGGRAKRRARQGRGA